MSSVKLQTEVAKKYKLAKDACVKFRLNGDPTTYDVRELKTVKQAEQLIKKCEAKKVTVLVPVTSEKNES